MPPLSNELRVIFPRIYSICDSHANHFEALIPHSLLTHELNVVVVHLVVQYLIMRRQVCHLKLDYSLPTLGRAFLQLVH